MGKINEMDQVGAGMYRDETGKGLDSMMAVGDAPWHFSYNDDMIRLLEANAEVKSKDVNSVAGLDWNVYQAPAYMQMPDGAYRPVGASSNDPDYLWNIRDDNHRVVGVVKKRYTIFQNAQAPIFLDSLVEDGDALYETAGSLYGGAQVFWLMRLPELVTVAGDPREGLQTYLLLTNSHDGSTSIVLSVVTVRVVCQNTLAWALDSAIRTTKIRHTPGAPAKVSEARRALEIGFKYTEELAAIGDKMMHTRFSDVEFQKFMNQLVPTPEAKMGYVGKKAEWGVTNKRGITIAENTKGTIKTIYDNHPTQVDIRGTVWGAVQAVQFYSDHEALTKDTANASADENRFKRLVDGKTLGADAFKKAVALV